MMWKQADSALKVMMEFAASPEADSLNEFEGYYCQVLIAELLFKNDYGQSNREEVLKAVRYFDSIVRMDGADTRGKLDARGASVQERDGFLAARAHYMNGVGFYERDSVVAACGEYLKALEIVETHFPNLETQDVASLRVEHLPRFMALTYNRLGDLFEDMFMQNAIYCYKKSLVFTRIEPTSPNGMAKLLSSLGQQYHFLYQYDSANYYFDEALKHLSDTNNLAYRDLISQKALLNYNMGKGIEPSVNDLRRIAGKAEEEKERQRRFVVISHIYYDAQKYDSALVYLVQAFKNEDDVLLKWDAAGKLRNIYQSRGDSLKAVQYALYQSENAISEAESNAQVSQLNELFQRHLQWEQERAEAERQQAARRRNLWIGGMVALLAIVGLAVAIMTRRSHRKRLAAQEAKVQILNEEKQQLQTQVDDTLQQLQTQADDALQQARAMLPQRVADLYRAKVPNRLERIIDEFEVAYPQALEKLAAAYPELNETEQQIAVLNFLHFRAKEEADLLDLSENTVNKYRSNLRKKTENASFSSFLD